MKSVYIFLAFILVNTAIFAQQTAASEDALLLDYYQNQRFKDAADYLKKTYPEPVTDKKILAKLAYTSQMAGKLPDAEGYYQRIYDSDPTNTAVLFNLGSINLHRGNTLKAGVYYKKIIEKDTTNFMVYKQLANISYDQSDPANQLIYLKKANQLNPAEPDVASDLGDLYVALKQFSLAKNILDDAISQDPENAVLLLSELKLAYSQNDWADTKAAAMALTQTGNHSGFVLTRLGVAYYYLKDYECCLETLSEMSPMEQTETSCYFTAMAYKGINDQPNAIVYMTKAIDEGISANICNYYSEMADSYETLKKFKKSIIAYQKGLQFEEKPLIYYLMATLYDSDLKNKKVALGYYKKYLAANPPAKEEKYIVFAKSRIGLLKR